MESLDGRRVMTYMIRHGQSEFNILGTMETLHSTLQARVMKNVGMKDRTLTLQGYRDALMLYRCLHDALPGKEEEEDGLSTACDKKVSGFSLECGRERLRHYALHNMHCNDLGELDKEIEFGGEKKSVAQWIVDDHRNLVSNLRRALDTYSCSVGLLQPDVQNLEIDNDMQEFSLTPGGDAASLLTDIEYDGDIGKIVKKISAEVDLLSHSGDCSNVDAEKVEQCKTIGAFCETSKRNGLVNYQKYVCMEAVTNYLTKGYESAITRASETSGFPANIEDNQRNDRSSWKENAKTSMIRILDKLSDTSHNVATLSGHSNFWLKTIQAFDAPDSDACARQTQKSLVKSVASLVPGLGAECKIGLMCKDAFGKKIGNGGVLMIEWIRENREWSIVKCELVFGHLEGRH